jgi:hypothetical protein
MQQPPGGQWGGQWGGQYAVPMPDPRRQDDEHLKLLAVLHYVMAALLAFFSLIPLIYVAFGVMMLHGVGAPPASSSTSPFPAEQLGWVFIGFGALVTVIGEVFAVLTFVAGRSLSARRRWFFCVVIAALSTLNTPLGTALGVFALIVLTKTSVKATFESNVT